MVNESWWMAEMMMMIMKKITCRLWMVDAANQASRVLPGLLGVAFRDCDWDVDDECDEWRIMMMNGEEYTL